MDPPDINEMKILQYVIKRKLIKDAVLGYESFKAQNLDDNTMLTLKLYTKNKPDETLPTVFA